MQPILSDFCEPASIKRLDCAAQASMAANMKKLAKARLMVGRLWTAKSTRFRTAACLFCFARYLEWAADLSWGTGRDAGQRAGRGGRGVERARYGRGHHPSHVACLQDIRRLGLWRVTCVPQAQAARTLAFPAETSLLQWWTW